ncbi:MAG: hypothetical protein WCJ95_17895 [Mariniphaga sp.]
MKKQVSSVSIMSAKSKFSVTVLCALLGATEVNANNYSLLASNEVSKAVRPENRIETSRNATPWGVKISDEEVEVKTIEVIEQWIAEGSYWSEEDSLSNDLKVSENKVNVAKAKHVSGLQWNEDRPFIFNADSFIQNSEF